MSQQSKYADVISTFSPIICTITPLGFQVFAQKLPWVGHHCVRSNRPFVTFICKKLLRNIFLRNIYFTVIFFCEKHFKRNIFVRNLKVYFVRNIFTVHIFFIRTLRWRLFCKKYLFYSNLFCKKHFYVQIYKKYFLQSPFYKKHFHVFYKKSFYSTFLLEPFVCLCLCLC